MMANGQWPSSDSAVFSTANGLFTFLHIPSLVVRLLRLFSHYIHAKQVGTALNMYACFGLVNFCSHDLAKLDFFTKNLYDSHKCHYNL